MAVEEASKLMMLDHDNLIKFYEYFKQENHIYLSMELCEYGDLDILIK